MAPKKRLKTTAKKRVRVTDTLGSSAKVVGSILTAGALADLQYLEPTRTRNRVVSCFEELFSRLERLEHLHREDHG